MTTYLGRKNRLCREWTGPPVEEGLKKVSVHANMTFVDWRPQGLFVNCSESQENNNTCQWYNVSAPHFNRTQTGLWHQCDELLNW